MIKQKVHSSVTLALVQKVHEYRLRGEDVVSFAAGEPDFDTPEVVTKAAIASMRKGNTRYVSSQGLLTLREGIAKDYAKRLGVKWATAENVIVTAGAKQGIYLFLAALLNAGDEVLVPRPFWVSYPHVIQSVGGHSVEFDTKESSGFFPSIAELEALKTSRTKALLFASPSNPAGTMIDLKLLKEIALWCRKNKITLIFDEIYERLVLRDVQHVSPLSFLSEDEAEYVVSVNAFSKTLAMTGWRVGFLVSHAANIAALAPLQGQMLTCLPGFVQDGAAAGIRDAEKLTRGYVKKFKKRADAMCAGLAKIPNVKFIVPQGAFYILVDVRKVMDQKKISTDSAFADKLFNEARGHGTWFLDGNSGLVAFFLRNERRRSQRGHKTF